MTVERPRRTTPPWRRLLEWSFFLAVLVFLVLYVRSVDWERLRSVEPVWWALVVATVLALAFRYWGAFIWTQILRTLGAHDVRLSPGLTYVYAKAWLGRYIPGTAPWILGKIYFASQHGVPRRKLAVSSLLEGGLQILVQLVFALLLLALDPRAGLVPPSLRVTFVAVLVACAIALVPPVFNRVVQLPFRLLRRPPLDAADLPSGRTVATGFALYVAGSVVGGLSLFFIAKTVYAPLSWAELPFVVGVSTLAGAVSMLAVFAPGGIGVREGIQIALLSLIMPTEFAFVIAVATRVHGLAVDGAFFGLAWAGTRRRAQGRP